MKTRQKVLLSSGIFLLIAIFLCAGFLAYQRFLTSSFSPEAVLAQYEIKVTGDSWTVSMDELLPVLRNEVKDADAAAYYRSRFWPWETETTLSPGECYVLVSFVGTDAPYEELAAQRGKTILWEVDGDMFAFHEN